MGDCLGTASLVSNRNIQMVTVKTAPFSPVVGGELLGVQTEVGRNEPGRPTERVRFFAWGPRTYDNRQPMDSEGTGSPYLASMRLARLQGLEEGVSMRFDKRRTILVGRNGAGKSLLLEGLHRAAQMAVMGTPRAGVPMEFECEIVSRDDRIGYTFLNVIESSKVDEEEGFHTNWTERCWNINTGDEHWRVEDDTLILPNSEPLELGPGIGLMSIRRTDRDETRFQAPPELRIVRSILTMSAMVGSGNIRAGARQNSANELLVAKITPDGKRRWYTGIGPRVRPPRIGRLSAQIANMFENREEEFQEFVGLMGRLGLLSKVDLAVYELEKAADDSPQAYGMPRFDGVPISNLSDGTLRVAEIVLALIRYSPLLLIEEPELAVHPGLLGGLLNEVDAYNSDHQIMVSTHSPQVVSWCRPNELRLVRRKDSVTVVDELTSEQVNRVCSFISDEGTLGDYVFCSPENE